MKTLTALALLVATSSPGARAETITLGQATIAGSGCPKGTAEAIITPDGQGIELKIAPFVAEAGGFAGKTLESKTCNVVIPVSVPAGVRLGVPAIRVAGTHEVPKVGKAQVSVETFFAGSSGPRVKTKLKGSGEFAVDSRKKGMLWSDCGTDVLVRISVSAQASISAARGVAQVQVERIGATDAGLPIQFAQRSCK